MGGIGDGDGIYDHDARARALSHTQTYTCTNPQTPTTTHQSNLGAHNNKQEDEKMRVPDKHPVFSTFLRIIQYSSV